MGIYSALRYVAKKIGLVGNVQKESDLEKQVSPEIILVDENPHRRKTLLDFYEEGVKDARKIFGRERLNLRIVYPNSLDVHD